MWDLKCVAAATCFGASNILYVIYGVHVMSERSHSHTANETTSGGDTQSFHNFTHWKELDPTYIEESWAHREMARPLMTWAALFGSLAWFWLIVPILQSAWILSRGGKRMVGAHMLLGSLAVFGGLIELLAHLLLVGMNNAATWLAKDFNLDSWVSDNDGTGWRVLEMIHVVTHGMTLWVDAFETLAIFGIVTVLFYSVYTEPKYKLQSRPEALQDNQPGDVDISVSTMDRVGAELEGSINTSESNNSVSQPPASAFKAISNKVDFNPTFSKCFISYGLFIGAFAILDFIADVLRFMNWHVFGHLSMAMNVIVGIVFLPIWLLIFAKQLPEATSRFERTQRWEGMIGNGDDETSGLMRKGEAA